MPDTSDPFVTKDIADNWGKVDNYPGIFVCTSSTRPSNWGTSKKGMSIVETDTLLRWQWDGAAFRRQGPTGILKTASGAWAIGDRVTDKATVATVTPQIVIAVTSVVVPAGNRPLRIDVSWSQSTNPNGNFYGYIYRSNINGGAPELVRWVLPGNSTIGGSGGSFFVMEPNGLAAGNYDWSFQIMSSGNGGTSTVVASAGSPAEIVVTEL